MKLGPNLDRGQFLGQVIHRREVGPFLLNETHYPAHADIPSHTHKNGYFCLVRKGAYRETFGSRRRDCGPLTVAYHPPGESHSERFLGCDCQSFNVELPIPWLDRIRHGSILAEPLDAHGGPPADLAMRLYREFHQVDSVSALAIEGLILEVAAALCRATAKKDSRIAPSWIARIHDLLCDRFAEELSIAQLAREAEVHPVYLNAAFRKYYHSSIGAFVRLRRIAWATDQLANTRRPIAEIALAAGFADQSHLCRTLKQFTGLTPTAIREQRISLRRHLGAQS